MLTELIAVCDSSTPKITIGRRGTHDSEQVVFNLTHLIGTYGAGSAVLMVKRPQDETAYQAVTTQDETTLTWVISDVDTAYKGSGECEIFWYVDDALAKTVIYPLAILRDIGETTEEPPAAYPTWVDHLTGLGAETLENARKAAESENNAKVSEDNAKASEESAALSKDTAIENALKSEGYAVGEQNGEAVSSESPYFQNNAKHWSQMAQEAAGKDGWVHFYIDEEDVLHYVKTANAALAFYIDLDGILHATNA